MVKNHIQNIFVEFNLDHSFDHYGCAAELIKDNVNYTNVIGIKKSKDIYSIKSILVHEISHVVTHIMENYNIQDDEFRAYLNQYLYSEGILFIEEAT